MINPDRISHIQLQRKRDERMKIARGLVHQATGLELQYPSRDYSEDALSENTEVGTEGVQRLGQKLHKHRIAHSSRRSWNKREKPRGRQSAPGGPVIVAERNDNHASSTCDCLPQRIYYSPRRVGVVILKIPVNKLSSQRSVNRYLE